MTLTKRQIAKKVSIELEIPFEEALHTIQCTLDTIRNELADGGRVEFRNFGVFDVYGISARVGRNPKRPSEVVVIPPRNLVRFHPGKELKRDVN